MTLRILFWAGLGLLAFKIFFRRRFRELGARLDRAVNVTIVLIALAYGARMIWWFVRGQ